MSAAAFVVPVLERLYRLHWTGSDGLGALIISPTRELALQVIRSLNIFCILISRCTV
jgi:ATP-dependent RNA helicase DDX10/DBP4